MHIVQASDVKIPGALDQLCQAHEQITQAVEQYQQQFEQLKLSVQNLIEQYEPEYFKISMDLYKSVRGNETTRHVPDVWELYDLETNCAVPDSQFRAYNRAEANARMHDYQNHGDHGFTFPDTNRFRVRRIGTAPPDLSHVLDRHMDVDPITAKTIQQRLRLYTDWRHPCMVIRPAHALHVQDLVACDPMYFVDTDRLLLNLTESWFTPEYQRRLRQYVIEDHKKQPAFQNLPADQFGLIYAFNFFDHQPWPIFQQYLKQCFDLLRPGGVVAFTYNNCDIANRVGKVEHCFGSYTPGRLVREYTSELGYQKVFDLDDDANTSWMELRRPGTYSSIRGAQTLAAILQRS